MAEVFDADSWDLLQRLRLCVAWRGRGQPSSGLKDRVWLTVDYRPYSPGDDLRAIDWNIYRRAGKGLSAAVRGVDDPPHLLPDVSNSFVEEERRIVGLRAAFALAASQPPRQRRSPILSGSSSLSSCVAESAVVVLHQFAEALQGLSLGAWIPERRLRLRRPSLGGDLRRDLRLLRSGWIGGLETVAFRRARHRLIFVQAPSSLRQEADAHAICSSWIARAGHWRTSPSRPRCWRATRWRSTIRPRNRGAGSQARRDWFGWTRIGPSSLSSNRCSRPGP